MDSAALQLLSNSSLGGGVVDVYVAGGGGWDGVYLSYDWMPVMIGVFDAVGAVVAFLVTPSSMSVMIGVVDALLVLLLHSL